MMEKFLLTVQHVCNPLHVYCRLIEKGLSRRSSLRVSSYYELIVFKLLNMVTLLAIGVIRYCKRSLGILT
jgi:hypothetical protein